MQSVSSAARVRRFGAFSLDLTSGELRKHGVRIRLQDQPFQVLVMLLARPGEVVTREDLRQKLWPADTFVDFEQGLNSAILRLRGALSDSAEHPRFIETLPRRGYRFLAIVESNEGNQQAASEIHAPTYVAAPATRIAPRWLAGSAITVLLVLSAWTANVAGLRTRLLGASPPATQLRSIAVLPLESHTGDAEQEYFVDGMTDDLITHLAGIRSLRVPSRKSAMRYKGEKRSLAEIARELRVEAVVTGTVTRLGGRIRIQLQLIDAASGRRRWANTYERDLTEVLFLQKEAARAVAEEAGVELNSEEITRFASAAPVNREAQLLYWRGRFHWHKGTPATPEEYETGREFFEKAIAEDATYAPAYLAMASYYFVAADLGFLPSGEAYARRNKAASKARLLDPSSAHLASTVPSLFYEWNWPEAEKGFQRAIELNPNSADMHQQYSVYLRRMGRLDDAIAEAKKACEFDPLVSDFAVSLGWAYYYAHQFAPAIQQFQKVLVGDKQSLAARFGLAKALEKNGMEKEAITQWEEILAESNAEELAATLRRTYNRSGYQAAMKELWQVQLQYFRKESQEKYVSPIKFATLHALLNEKDAAFSWLEKAFAEGTSRLADLKSDADFGNLHADPRFTDLVRRIGLP